jgi:uncharacterized protein DUF4012
VSVEATHPDVVPSQRMRRRTRVVLASGAALLTLLALGIALLAFRYIPALDDARSLRADLESIVDQAESGGLDIDMATVDDLDRRLAAARTRLERLQALASGDLLIGLARALPPSSASVRGADELLAAGAHLLDAAGEGLTIGRRYVEIRDSHETDAGDSSALAQLVELLATTRSEADRAAGSVMQARSALAAVPEGAIGPISNLEESLSARIDRYAPMLDTYLDASQRVPAIFGWNGARRYLVLTQDPAELRPTGGFIGSYGIVSFERGEMTEHRFEDIVPLDYPFDYPRIEPPQQLADYLLGARQPWQLADANWSPDFPTSARDALRLYTNESGDTDIDGVLGITTHSIDEVLRLTGPVNVPAYNVTIESGETTLKALQLTRSAPPGEDRKAFLPAFADSLFGALFSLSSDSWAEVLSSAGTFRDGRLLLAWFTDPTEEAFAARAGLDGAVRQDPGDYVFPVDANVGPASKLNAWTSRTLDLSVDIDEFGNARHTLDVTWKNEVETPAGATYRDMDNVGGRILGMYFRLLVPLRSRVEEVSGGTMTPVTGPAAVDEEAGRTVIGTYVKVPAGPTTLRYRWTSPYAAENDAAEGSYRLTIQAQPGSLPGPLQLTIRVPNGASITAASPELVVNGGIATLDATFEHDLVLGLRYAP